MKKLFKDRMDLTIYLAIVILFTFFSIAEAYLPGIIIDQIKNKSIVKNLVKIIIYSIFIIIICNFFLYLKNQKELKIRRNFMIDLKNNIAKTIFSKDIVEFNNIGKDYFHNLLTKDIEIYDSAINVSYFRIIESIIAFLITSIFLIGIKPVFFPISLISVVLSMIIPKILNKKKDVCKKNYSKENEKLISFIKDSIFGSNVIYDFGIFNIIEEKFKEKNKKVLSKDENLSRLNYIIESETFFTGFFIYLVVLSIAVFVYIKGEISPGEVIVASQLTNMIKSPIIRIVNSYYEIKSTNYIKEKFNIEYKEDKKEKIYFDKIQIRNLSFSYKNNIIFKKASIDFLKNKKYLIVGKSGAGKSTLMKILLKELPYEGSIKINKELKDISFSSLYDLIAPVFQKTIIFNDSIDFNIKLNEKSKNNLLDIVKEKTEIKSFQSNRLIEENHKNFSTGQMQRIQLARAFYRKRDIFILDEAFSSIDYENQLKIEKELTKINATIINISHRITEKIVDLYDYVIFVENNKLNLFGIDEAKKKLEENGFYEKDNI